MIDLLIYLHIDLLSVLYQVNLRYGVRHDMSRTGSEKDTCTACAGSMLLEFSALSRLTGNKAFEVSFHALRLLSVCLCRMQVKV